MRTAWFLTLAAAACGDVTTVSSDAGSDAAAVECDDGWAGPDCTECVVYVDGSGGEDSRSGLSWSAARETIEAGIQGAEDRMGPGIYSCSVWVLEGT